MGRQTAGVIGMRLAEDDEVMVLGVASQGEETDQRHAAGLRQAHAAEGLPDQGRGGKA